MAEPTRARESGLSRIVVRLRATDTELLTSLAASRSQSLQKYVSELLECHVADVRGCESGDRGMPGDSSNGLESYALTAATYRVHLPSGRRLL
jgi:hypothetical protein